MSLRGTRILLTSLGVLLLINGSIQLTGEEWVIWRLVLAVTTIGIGLSQLVLGLYFMAPNSKWAPRAEIGPERLLFKNDIWVSPTIVPWNRIKEITLTSYLVIFKLDDNTNEEITINTTDADISRQIKSKIRDLALSRGIDVSDG